MTTQIPTITPEQLHAAQQHGDRPALIDVRTVAEYRAGHIPGSQRLTVGKLCPDVVTRRFKPAAPGHQEPLCITCRSAVRHTFESMVPVLTLIIGSFSIFSD